MCDTVIREAEAAVSDRGSVACGPYSLLHVANSNRISEPHHWCICVNYFLDMVWPGLVPSSLGAFSAPDSMSSLWSMLSYYCMLWSAVCRIWRESLGTKLGMIHIVYAVCSRSWIYTNYYIFVWPHPLKAGGAVYILYHLLHHTCYPPTNRMTCRFKGQTQYHVNSYNHVHNSYCHKWMNEWEQEREVKW